MAGAVSSYMLSTAEVGVDRIYWTGGHDCSAKSIQIEPCSLARREYVLSRVPWTKLRRSRMPFEADQLFDGVDVGRGLQGVGELLRDGDRSEGTTEE